jgi:hypothetical protein
MSIKKTEREKSPASIFISDQLQSELQVNIPKWYHLHEYKTKVLLMLHDLFYFLIAYTDLDTLALVQPHTLEV